MSKIRCFLIFLVGIGVGALIIPTMDADGSKVGDVILYKSGQAKKSPVKKIGSRCWVSWYANIEKVLLHGDGTAYDQNLRYRWTLNRVGADDPKADEAWFAQNCAEPLPEPLPPAR